MGHLRVAKAPFSRWPGRGIFINSPCHLFLGRPLNGSSSFYWETNRKHKYCFQERKKYYNPLTANMQKMEQRTAATATRKRRRTRVPWLGVWTCQTHMIRIGHPVTSCKDHFGLEIMMSVPFPPPRRMFLLPRKSSTFCRRKMN